MKRTKTIFFLILIISSNISLAFGIPNEGYGEDSQALGQFVDTFTDLNNISIIENIVRNSTYNAMELNKSHAYYDVSFTDVRYIEDFEDFPTGWTVNTANGGTITKDNAQVFNGSFSVKVNTPANNRQAYAYQSIPEETGDYDLEYYIYPSSSYHPDDVYVLFTNDVGTGSHLHMTLDYVGSDYILKNNGVNSVGVLNVNEWNRINIHWDDTINKLNYSINLEFKGLFNPLGDVNPDRIYIGDTSAVQQSGVYWLDDIRIGDSDWEVLFDYGSEGYFTTTNYLNDSIANGSILVQMTNTTMPDNTQITVEFSPDNATWTLNDWQPIFGGFESIDLRDLNWSIAYYIRYNLSTTDSTVTPRVYQSRLITTIGNSTGGGGVPVVGGGINSATILMLILLFALAVLIYLGVKRR